MRGYVDVGDGAVLCLHTIFDEAPCQSIVAQIAEEVFVIHVHFALSCILQGSPDVLVLVSHLVGMRIELAVWTYNSVAVEVVVAWVVTVVVATISIFYLSELLIGQQFWFYLHRNHDAAMQALIHEIPVETTLEDRIFAYQIPVFFQITARVTHRMVVLALYERHLAIWVLAVILAVLYRIIHWAEDVCAFSLASLLILYWAALVL